MHHRQEPDGTIILAGRQHHRSEEPARNNIEITPDNTGKPRLRERRQQEPGGPATPAGPLQDCRPQEAGGPATLAGPLWQHKRQRWRQDKQLDRWEDKRLEWRQDKRQRWQEDR